MGIEYAVKVFEKPVPMSEDRYELWRWATEGTKYRRQALARLRQLLENAVSANQRRVVIHLLRENFGVTKTQEDWINVKIAESLNRGKPL